MARVRRAPLKGDFIPPVALIPATFTQRNETIAHLIANDYVAADVAPIYGISVSRARAIAREQGVKITRGGSRRGFRSTDPLKIVGALRFNPQCVSKEEAARAAGVSLLTVRRVLLALGMQESINRLLRLRRHVEAQKCRAQ